MEHECVKDCSGKPAAGRALINNPADCFSEEPGEALADVRGLAAESLTRRGTPQKI
jgi:hypothetical protein